MSNLECLEANKSSTDNEIISSLQQNEEVKEIKDDQTEGQNNRVDESDEDIPGDFFDDFLKEDFMAGLDIVDDDEWDEDKIKNNGEVKEKSEKDVDASPKKRVADSTKKRKKQKGSSKNNDGKLSGKQSASENKEKRSRQKKVKYEVKQDSKQKHNSDKQIDTDEFDIRRDPEKTKRDIARDKVRCEKDKEMKIISEKLSLVETGLVPPGTEMEIDIEEVKRQKEKIENKSPRDLREHLKDLKGRNKSPVHREKSLPKKRSVTRSSPLATRRVSPLRRRSRSPRRDLITLRSPRRSPLRRISSRRLSPLKRRSAERVVYGRRRSRSHSPIYRNRRAKYSPYRIRNRSNSRESDREKWLKYRNRSRSPRRKRDEKKSFLQEIAEKLNEIRHPPNVMSHQPMQPILQPMQPALRYVQPQALPIPVPVPAPAPIPVPVPPPNNASVFPEPQQQYDPYDQNFFIGTPQSTGPNNFPCPPLPSPLSAGPQMPMNPMSSQAMNSFVMPDNLTSAMNMSNTQRNYTQTAHGRPEQKPEKQEDITKLFQDKRITLSEFLAITAKPEVFSSSPTRIQEKIKVITRCHEAIKILASSEKKYSGRLNVYNTDKYKTTDKHISPLKRVPAMLFSFTDPVISTENQKKSFTQFINGLLQKLGLLIEAPINLDDEQLSGAPATDTKSIPKFSPPPPPLITPIKNEMRGRPNIILCTNRLSKMVQTDVFKCENCEKRKKILYHSTAIQADNSSVTFSVSTQVTEEDFQPKIPKTQSLAALTPAQLLAKSRESLNAATRAARAETDFDIHPTGYNRAAFFRTPDNYNLPRPNLPHFPNAPSMYDGFNSQILGGGGRGREPNGPRTLDHNIRYSHNNYY